MTRNEEIAMIKRTYPGYDSSLHSKVKRPEYYGIRLMPLPLPLAGKTQVEQVLEYLKTYGSITTAEAFSELGITRLSARISDLKDLGYEFDTKAEDGTNRHGKKVKYARYRIKNEP